MVIFHPEMGIHAIKSLEDGNTTLNGCGCMVYNDARKPGGCVKVKDVEKSRFEGVRRVKIIMKDTWFTEDETWTDDLGCWKIDERYHGNAWMWIKFANSRGQIREHDQVLLPFMIGYGR